MGKLPNEIKLSLHAQIRLGERNDVNIKYNIQNIMRSSVKWYSKDDLIQNCALYRHCCYTTRKSNQMGYITDGNIEILYNKNTHVGITVLSVKDKFKPITQYIKPEIILKKEEKKKMKCIDCGKEGELNSDNICERCIRRKVNMKARGKEYIRYLDLSEKEKLRIDKMIESQSKRHKPQENSNIINDSSTNLLSDEENFITILKECGCEISENSLKSVLNILINTDKLKDILMTIADNNSQNTMLDLEQALSITEKKLQYNWEYNGFQEEDDIKFKNFLAWRRVLRGAIFFWKKLYQTNTLLEMQRAWNMYTQNPIEKLSIMNDKNKLDSTIKRFQITTESISTILNTKRPFTRVFYATDQDTAYNLFKQWMSDRNLHENKSKTIITELTNDNLTNDNEIEKKEGKEQ